VPVDSNATERALRGIVVGRKNHYGSSSQRGTEVAALFYSVIETCKLIRCRPNTTAPIRLAVKAVLRPQQAHVGRPVQQIVGQRQHALCGSLTDV